jgi:hypothetical protein
MEKAYRETESGCVEMRDEPVLAWKVHLLRDDPMKVLLITPFALVSLLICFVIFHSLLFSAVVLFLFASALAEYLFPVRYEITERGASARTLLGRTEIAWDRVKKFYLDDRGIKLSPLLTPGRLEAYRGVYLRFGDREDEVVRVVRRMRDVARTDDESR